MIERDDVKIVQIGFGSLNPLQFGFRIVDESAQILLPVFRKFVPQLLHIVVLPVFFFTFMLLLRPEGVVNMLGKEWFGVHLTIMSCIILVSEILIRMLYYFLPLRINYSIYTLWCFGEIIFMSFFTALYLWLVLGKTMLYFEFVTASFRYLFLSLIFAYAILAHKSEFINQCHNAKYN